ncbi:MAG: CHAT domain-containing protein [Gammaproteobacteria bacterium]|nr:CHAT domain-containing protein [Gammaproteobacteria bacterium]
MLPENTVADKKRIAAEQLMTEAHALNINPKDKQEGQEKANYEIAMEKYQAAIEIWSGLDDFRNHAKADFAIANHYYWNAYDWKKTAKHAGAAAESYAKAGEKLLHANAQHLAGAALIEDMETDKAMQLFNQALDIQRELGATYDEAVTINNIGLLHFYKSEYETAQNYFARAKILFEDLNERQKIALSQANVGVMAFYRGALTEAIAQLQEAQDLLAPLDDQWLKAELKNNIAWSEATLGDFTNALIHYNEAREQFAALQDKSGEARSLRGIAFSYAALGKRDQAKTFFRTNLEKLSELNDIRGQLAVLSNLGKLERQDLNIPEAIGFHEKALGIAESPSERSQMLIEIGADYLAAGETSSAIEQFEKALRLSQEQEDGRVLASAKQWLGAALVDTNPQQSEKLLLQAMAMHEEHYSEIGQISVLHALARLKSLTNNIDTALRHLKSAEKLIDSMRWRVSSRNLRIAHSLIERPTLDLHINLLMSLHENTGEPASPYQIMALQINEKLKSRVFRESIQKAKLNAPSEYHIEDFKKLDALRKNIIELYDARDNLSEKDQGKRSALQEKINSALIEADVIQEKLYRSNPHLIASNSVAENYIDPLEIVKKLSDDKEHTILVYHLSEKSSYVWKISSHGIESWKLPPKQEIEKLTINAFEKLRHIKIGADSSEQSDSIEELADILLTPLLNATRNGRLTIVADGLLHYLPFDALPILEDNQKKYLIEQYEINASPSLVTASYDADKENNFYTNKSLLMVADPVYNANDDRLSSPIADAENPGNSEKSFQNASPSLNELHRLLATANEALEITKLANNSGWRTTSAQGLDATKQAVLGKNLKEFDVLHFATHGIVNTEEPEYSSLVLSAFDEKITPTNAFLYLYEIYDLQVDANLVVLSACETVGGRLSAGEGLIGLAHGFLLGGTRNVIASLWKAEDAATAELMRLTYQGMFRDGLTPSTALRMAKIRMLGTPYDNPFFWSGFRIYTAE